MNLSALTSPELETVLNALDAFHVAYDKLALECMEGDDDLTTEELYSLIVEEMTARTLEDAGYKVNQMVARGELDRYMRPDGQIGYAPPGAWDEVDS